MRISNHIYDIITKLILGTLSKEESQELDNWLAESPRHKEMLDNFLARKDMSELLDLPQVHKDAGKHFKEGIIPMVAKRHVRRISSFSNFSLRTFGTSVAAIAVVLIGLFWWTKYTEVVAPQLSKLDIEAMQMAKQTGHSDADITLTTGTGHATAQKLAVLSGVTDESVIDQLVENVQEKADVDEEEIKAQVATRQDKEFWLTLADGTRVHLNYNSRLVYPLHFVGDSRDVTLEGEAYFFVAKDRRHPFIVHTRCGDVKEYGTEFNVNTNAVTRANKDRNITRGNGVSVVLVNGSISVTPHGGHERMMKPNDMAVLDGTSAAPEIHKVDTAPLVAWNTGVFSFDDCTMEELMMVLGRWYNLDVNFVNPADGKQRFTGELDRYSDIHSALHAINNVTGMALAVEGRTLVVK